MVKAFAAVCLLLAIITRPAHAQTGMAPTDWEELAKIPVWEPEPTGYAESFSVDLRDRLPPVGKQSMGDCAAWAFGYAGKSFLEANDQGWKPDRPARTFSPTFLYNQLATGEQSGLSPLQVLNFLKDKGCATLATAPYLEKDFTTKPSRRAMDEAALFKISHFAILKDGADIRTALQQGHVVQIGVRTNPVFNSGNYPIYTADLHSQGSAQRRPGQLHGFHALVVVGFDDRSSSLVIMNSWGTHWGANGYCSVHYDVAKNFNSKAKGIESNLIDWAIVMHDVKEKIEIGPDGIAMNVPVDKESIAAIGSADYRGFDERLKKHVYFFNAALSGQKKALELVKSVEWNYDDRGNTQTLTGLSLNTGFSVNGRSVINEFTVGGKVLFADGSTKAVSLKLSAEAPQAKDRNLAFKVESRYHSKNNSGEPMWQWEVKPMFSAKDMQDVAKSTWDLSAIPREREKQRVYDDKTQQHPAYSGPGGFLFAAARITGRYFFKDGTVKDVALDIPVDDPVDDTYRMVSHWQEDGIGADGKMVYSYQVQLRMPMEKFFKVNTVKWDLGPGMAVRNPHSHSYNDYSAVGTTTREFRARCTITLRDSGETKSFDQWIELGKDARISNAHRLALESSDVYQGRQGAEPMWLTKVFPVGDTASFDRIEQVTYTMPKGYTPEQTTVKAADNADLVHTLYVLGPTAIAAKVSFKDGSSTDLEFTAKPRTPAQDGLTLEARGLSTPIQDPKNLTSLKLAGPGLELDAVRGIDCRYRLRSRWERFAFETQYLKWPELLKVTPWVDPVAPIWAVITFSDGSQEWLSTPYAGDAAPQQPSDLRLQLREAFGGYDGNGARYDLRASVVGKGALLDQIASIDYTIDLPAAKGIKRRVESPRSVLPVQSHGISRIAAEVTFKPESKLPPRVLEPATNHASAPRTEKPLVLKEYLQPWTKDGDRQWIVCLIGWEGTLADVENVTYTLPKGVSEKPVTVSQRNADRIAPFAYRGRSSGPVTVEAIVTMKDKSTQGLSLEVGGPEERLDYSVEQKYWGIDPRMTSGKPSWYLKYQATGDWKLIKSLDYISREWQTLYADELVYGAPFTMTDLVTEAPVTKDAIPLIQKQPQNPIKAKVIQLTAPRLDEFRVATSNRPIPGNDALKEWTIAIDGPERLMGYVEKVTYTAEDGAPLGQVNWYERWNDAGDGFPLRLNRTDLGTVKASITFVPKKTTDYFREELPAKEVKSGN